VIVPPQPDPKDGRVQRKFRWDPSLIERVKHIARLAKRDGSETSELLMEWALQNVDVPRKQDPEPVKFYWSEAIAEKLHKKAEALNRSDNELAELLMEEAVKMAADEFAQLPSATRTARQKK
jgi:hypothetical protein